MEEIKILKDKLNNKLDKLGITDENLKNQIVYELDVFSNIIIDAYAQKNGQRKTTNS